MRFFLYKPKTKTRLHLDILPQPNDSACGATCLNAIYRYFGDETALPELLNEVEHLEEGGTLGVLLGQHALKRGYRVTMYNYNLNVFDPTWFDLDTKQLQEKLKREIQAKPKPRLIKAAKAYLDFLGQGGEIRFTDLTPELIRRYMKKSVPILAGLSSTYLHRTPREVGRKNQPDDVRGFPVGHFVVLCGYDPKARRVLVADPYLPRLIADSQYYEVDIFRLISSILLGVLTYDANLLIIRPREPNR
jgi:hypothetical protein